MKSKLAVALGLLFVALYTVSALTLVVPVPKRVTGIDDFVELGDIVDTVNDAWKDFTVFRALNYTALGTEERVVDGVSLNVTEYVYDVPISGVGTFYAHAWLVLPESSEPVPCAILVHGEGADHEQLMPLAYEFAGNGIGALVIDGAGHGMSGAVGSHSLTLSPDELKGPDSVRHSLLFQFYRSVAEAVNLVLQIPACNPGPGIAVVGYSLGGMAAEVVGNVVGRVKAVVSIAGPGCLSCGAELGGLVSNIFPPGTVFNESVMRALIPIDPMSYTFLYHRKKLKVVMPTNDEVFPMESLDRYLALLTSFGGKFETLYLPNGGHQGVLEDEVVVGEVTRFVKNSLLGAEETEPLKPAIYTYPFITQAVGGNVWWRPAFAGAPYFSSSGTIPNLFASEFFLTECTKECTSSLVFITTRVYSMITVAVSAVVVTYALYVLLGRKYFIPASAATIIAPLLNAAPFAVTQVGTQLTFLDTIERYGANYAGLAMLLVILAPLLMFLEWVPKNRERTFLAVAYALTAISPVLVARAVLGREYLIWGHPSLSTYPVEVLFVILALSPWATEAIINSFSLKRSGAYINEK